MGNMLTLLAVGLSREHLCRKHSAGLQSAGAVGVVSRVIGWAQFGLGLLVAPLTWSSNGAGALGTVGASAMLESRGDRDHLASSCFRKLRATRLVDLAGLVRGNVEAFDSRRMLPCCGRQNAVVAGVPGLFVEPVP